MEIPHQIGCPPRIIQAWIRSVEWSSRTRRLPEASKQTRVVCFSAILSTTSSPLAIPCLPALTLCHRPWEPLTIDRQRSRSSLSQPSLADPLPPLPPRRVPLSFLCSLCSSGRCARLEHRHPARAAILWRGSTVIDDGTGGMSRRCARRQHRGRLWPHFVRVGRQSTINRAHEGGWRRPEAAAAAAEAGQDGG